MSVNDHDPVPVVCAAGDPHVTVELITARDVPLGGVRSMTVHRTLPQRRRSLIGAWCFIDHFGPDRVVRTGGMDVAPHPHTGLQTVTWLFAGSIHHNDSGGVQAPVRPGEVNFMTAGAGICHSEVSTDGTDILHGVQLWTALPETARHGARRFDHHAPDTVPFDGGEALVFVGSLLGETSPVHTFTPLVGAEIRLTPGASLDLPVDPDFEHGVLVDTGTVTVEGVTVERTELAYTGTGAAVLRLRNGDTPARLILLGGTPFPEQVVMWWNFVGRDDAEIRRFQAEWNSHGDRFGEVTGYVGHDPDGPDRLPAPDVPAVMLRARSNPAPVARPGDDPYRPKEATMPVPDRVTDRSGHPVEIRLTPGGTAYGLWIPGEDSPAGLTHFLDREEDGIPARVFFHTVVGDDYAGRGLAGILVDHALADTRDAGRTVVAVCPYVHSWIDKHGWDGPHREPDAADIAAVEEDGDHA
jgi:redox-sensitive bicupin YhaK (pirin superfamily)